MKDLFITLLALFTGVLFLSSCNTSTVKTTQADTLHYEVDSSVRSNYLEYCATCHGQDLNRFAGQSWVFGSTPEEMFKTIKLGRPSIGMPDFKQALSDEEIHGLAEYILEELPHMRERKEQFTKMDETIESEEFDFVLEPVVSGIGIPWGMTWLPDGDLLVAEKSGKLYRYSGKDSLLIEGMPEVRDQGQGGFMDIELHPEYEQNGWIYLAYADEADGIGQGGNTAIMRARLKDNTLVDKEEIFRALPNSTRGQHFGCRLEFDKDNYLFFAVGERGNPPNAQDLTNHCGKIHRIFDDGRIPPDNPFVDTEGAMPTIYSYGHRNPQGLAIDRTTGILWEHEHGPKGGDELNIIRKGDNYGWPEITFGINYDGTIITTDTAKAGMEQPVYYWIPSIAPCGMDFLDGDVYPGWEGNLFVGALSFKLIERMVIEDKKVIHRERLLENIGRVRNVKTGPDGYLYVAVEDPGRIFKLVPVTK